MASQAVSHYETITTPLSVAQLILRYLALEGTDTIFGIPGAAVMELLNELKDRRDVFRYVVCRQETGAAYIADGYYRATGKLGVVLVTSGPGATNALTGLVNAQTGGSALLTITGEVAQKFFGMGYLQEGIDAGLNVDAVYGNAIRYSAVVTSSANVQTLLSQALRDALSIPRHAVHVSLPHDVAAAAMPLPVYLPREPANYRATPRSANPWEAQHAFDALTSAHFPLIFVGSGCREALRGDRLAAFTSFVEKFAIPVMTTPDGKAIFPETHPLSLRNYGIAACEWPKAYMQPNSVDPAQPAQYDALLVLCTTLGELATMSGPVPFNPALIPNGPFIQVDLDQGVIGRAFPVSQGVVAEVGEILDAFAELSKETPPDQATVAARRLFVETLKDKIPPFAEPQKWASDATPVKPQALMRVLSELLPPGSLVFVDCGNSVGWALHYLVVDPPSQLHSSLAMGPMGFGVGAVIGAKLGAPAQTCVAVVGDGAFMMHGSEVSTAAQYGAGAIWIVLADNDLAMVSQGMNAIFPDRSDPTVWRDYYKLGSPDLAKYAQALGADAYNVQSPEDLKRAFRTAMRSAAANNRPQVIVAHIDTAEMPPYQYPKPQ